MSYTYQSYLELARSDLDEPLVRAHSAFYHLLLLMFPKKSPMVKVTHQSGTGTPSLTKLSTGYKWL
jgi:hypothetical protein